MNENTIKETAQYLTFRLGREMFALDVIQVREVLDVTEITKVPRAPEFMRGVINVRGSVVPVADLRVKFGMPQTETSLDTRIVVMEIAVADDTLILGALADSVHNVMDIEPDRIEPAPRIGTKWNTDFIRGIGKIDDQFVIILDIDKVFSSEQVSLLAKCQEEEAPQATEAA